MRKLFIAQWERSIFNEWCEFSMEHEAVRAGFPQEQWDADGDQTFDVTEDLYQEWEAMTPPGTFLDLCC
jgi:hypothetical protein